MRNQGPRGGLWDELAADPVTFFTVMIFLGLAGPALLVAFRDQVLGWLVAHQVLVAQEHAVVVVPSTSLGLDGRRLLVLGLLLLAAGAAVTIHVRAARGTKRAGR